MLERSVERKLGVEIKRRGGLWYKFVSPGTSGVPDRLAILPGGRCVFVELKQEHGALRKLQEWQIEKMRRQGAEVYVVHGHDEADLLLAYLFPTPHSHGR